MAMEIQLVPVGLAAIALEGCFYGWFVVLAIISICLLAGRRVKWLSPTFLSAIGIFITPFLQEQNKELIFYFRCSLALDLNSVDRSFHAFVFFENRTFPTAFYGDLSQITKVGKTAFLITTVPMGDAIIVGISSSPCSSFSSSNFEESSSLDCLGQETDHCTILC
ncbi:hypothetical protein R3P38DRAFT_1944104 [Favolaschia claudopus]|uniref:Uncharacterized protein n=1 Tax=Favolaschia claudopus TaxID=2862362 RepID=A0AAW0A0Q0_9AGAR